MRTGFFIHLFKNPWVFNSRSYIMSLRNSVFLLIVFKSCFPLHVETRVDLKHLRAAVRHAQAQWVISSSLEGNTIIVRWRKLKSPSPTSLPRRERDCTRRPPVYANPEDKNFTIILAAITKYLHEQTASYCYLTQEP